MKENWGQTSRQLHLYWYEMFEKLVKWRNKIHILANYYESMWRMISDKIEIKTKNIMFYTNKPAYVENTQ